MFNLLLVPALIQATAPVTTAPTTDMKGALIGLALGALQLIVSLVIFTFAINNGLKVVSKMIEGIDIWGEIKKKNIAVALLAAGAVIAYVNVVAGGVESMTNGLTSVVSGSFKSGLSALIGGVVNLIVALIVAGFAISWTFKAMDKLTSNIDEKAEFRSGNIAIGIVYAGILIGASDLIAAGVAGVSAALTTALNVLIG
ncbi:MAG: hypothetical protein SGI72_08275 [Planctomycetota bacterium]|nr:hypothetical protein [Planctomycetota bacterium]